MDPTATPASRFNELPTETQEFLSTSAGFFFWFSERLRALALFNGRCIRSSEVNPR
ncbi:hypothetical protein [Rhizobium sp. BK418]|uniref:hypothetical protein n=1 Tax=Rhizobium sp. BK418 TaxID=2512120 RepID=UPI0010D32C1E|nr:hypothetical protein [Rhizobium sp. BK418]TCR95981.1 hypothetical protein EV281_11229 [Rhizobium sp. BK418]